MVDNFVLKRSATIHSRYMLNILLRETQLKHLAKKTNLMVKTNCMFLRYYVSTVGKKLPESLFGW